MNSEPGFGPCKWNNGGGVVYLIMNARVKSVLSLDLDHENYSSCPLLFLSYMLNFF